MAVDRQKALSWHMQRHPLGLGRMHPDMSTCGLEGLKMLPKTTKYCGAGRGGRGGGGPTNLDENDLSRSANRVSVLQP